MRQFIHQVFLFIRRTIKNYIIEEQIVPIGNWIALGNCCVKMLLYTEI